MTYDLLLTANMHNTRILLSFMTMYRQLFSSHSEQNLHEMSVSLICAHLYFKHESNPLVLLGEVI